jgi:hypothetical protein
VVAAHLILAPEALPPLVLKGGPGDRCLPHWRRGGCALRTDKAAAAMKPSVLLIDDAEEYRILCAELVRRKWPDASVEQWTPSVRECRAPIRSVKHDVILDFDLGREDGLVWLKIAFARWLSDRNGHWRRRVG